jgi:hypothetical protein
MPVVKLYRVLEREIFGRVAERLAITGGEQTGTLNYQLQALGELQNIDSEIVQKLARVSGVAEIEIRQMVVDNGFAIMDDMDAALNRMDIHVLPSPDIQQLTDSYVKQTFLEINNYVNETLITTQGFGGSLTMMYRDILSDITLSFSVGHYTFAEAVETALMRWVDKGVPSSFIDRGGNRWSMKRYVQTVLRSTNARMYNELRISRMAEHDVHLVLMSSKESAREACAPIQGKVVDITPDRQYPKYPNVYDYGYGEPAGTRGINCGHLWFPFAEGISENSQVQYDPDEAMEMESLNQERNRMIRGIENLQTKIEVAKKLDSDSVAGYRKRLSAKVQKLGEFEKMLKDRRHDFYYRSA